MSPFSSYEAGIHFSAPPLRRAGVIVLALLFGAALPVSHAWARGGS
jgi:hypothetical protein